MKKIIFFFITLINSISFSQVITITYHRTKAFSTTGNILNSQEMVKLYDNAPIFDVEHSECKKIVDLNKMEVSFYENGNFQSILQIKSFEKNKNIYKIAIIDVNVIVGGELETYLYIDVAKNLSRSYWYYPHCNTTFMFNQYDNTILTSI